MGHFMDDHVDYLDNPKAKRLRKIYLKYSRLIKKVWREKNSGVLQIFRNCFGENISGVLQRYFLQMAFIVIWSTPDIEN